jgi:hypothetical protein
MLGERARLSLLLAAIYTVCRPCAHDQRPAMHRLLGLEQEL